MDTNTAKVIAVCVAAVAVVALGIISMKTGASKEYLTGALTVLTTALQGFKQ